ncbi:MAG TPA: hypothetical protein VIG80_07435 [Bacillaceae bacterium]
MLIRGVLFLIGFGLAVTGGVSLIAYLNLIAAGFSFSDYLSFIITRPECHLLLVGLFMVTGAVYSTPPKE